MADPKKFAVKMPGRVAATLAERAIRKMDHGIDEDLCEAISNLRMKRRGNGFTATVALTIEQAERLALWVKSGDQKYLRDWRDQLKLDLEATRVANTTPEDGDAE